MSAVIEVSDYSTEWRVEGSGGQGIRHRCSDFHRGGGQEGSKEMVGSGYVIH